MSDWLSDASLPGLFLSGLISATLLPGGSEALFGWMLLETDQSPWQMFLAVTAGNTLGGLIAFAMGLMLALRWPLKQPEKKSQQKAKAWIERWGVLALLLSWLPIVGDPLCFVAGWLRLNIWWSALMIACGKAARYLVLLLALN